MLKRLLCAAAVMVCFSTSAQAINGKKVVDICEMDKEHCDAFLNGLVLALIPLVNAAKCSPDVVNVGQVKAVFLKFLRSNPSLGHVGLHPLFDEAMKDAFNCKHVFRRAWLATQELAKTKPAPNKAD